MLSLDTSIAIEILKRRSGRETRARLEAARQAGARIFVGSIVLHELMVGALKSGRAPEEMQRGDNLLARLEVVGFSADDAISAARVRADLEGTGAGMGALDTLIAGQALARGWMLVTKNVQHFLRVDGLVVVDWTRSDQPLDRREMQAQMLRRLKEPK